MDETGMDETGTGGRVTVEYLEAVERLVGREFGGEEPEELPRAEESPELTMSGTAVATVTETAIIKRVAAYRSDSRDAWLVTWQYDRAARTYELQTNTDPSVTHRWSSVWCGRDEGAWVVPYGTKSGCWVRLRALYPEGYGPWCDPLYLKPGEGAIDKAA